MPDSPAVLHPDQTRYKETGMALSAADDEWLTEDDDYDPAYFDCSGVVDGFGVVHSDADPGL